MLVLSRNASEGIWVGEDIHIVILEVKGKRCRVGIQAPDDVEIWRDELCDTSAIPSLRRMRNALKNIGDDTSKESECPPPPG